ncbi:MAG: SHOCT domain-containing protein [Clostridia bacterium]|nr:SHOCT domain-containing protein [Clostridia bacterium]
MSEEKNNSLSTIINLEDVISNSIKIPGVKVNRKSFLAEQFAKQEKIQEIIDQGPIEAGIQRETIDEVANKLIVKRTSQSSIASFVAGIPGGFAMMATIPADVMQFFGMALRLAQELSYLYGAEDLFVDGDVSDERVKSQLIMYCGVMFGVSGAVTGVRVLTTQIAKTAGKKIPQKALTKTIWYPIVKKIGKAIGVKITKSTIGNAAEKAIPIVGGVISGTMNFASMMPMAKRLMNTLDKASFDYSDEDFAADIDAMERMANGEEIDDVETSTFEELKDKVSEGAKSAGAKASEGLKIAGAKASGLFEKIRKKPENEEKTIPVTDPFEEIKKYKELLDMGIISQEDFEKKKSQLLGL